MIKLSFFFLFLFSFSVYADAYQLLKERFRQDLVLDASEARTFKVPEIKTWIGSIQSNGSWNDIDYQIDDNQFSPGYHARRMDWMARAYSSPGHPFYQNESVLSAVLKSYDYWIKVRPASYNWWHNTIGIPQRFARTMLLMEKHLTEKQIESGIYRSLQLATIERSGQNRLWYSELVFIRGLFKKSSYELSIAAKELHQIVKLENSLSDKSQGLQVDLSFHQHGKLIYNGGYGSKFTLDAARLMTMMEGTPYAFSTEKRDLISRYILDAQIWLTRADKWDYSVTGREITRPGKNAYRLIKACDLMRSRDFPRQREFEKCYQSLTQGQSFLTGNKRLWRSDYMIQQNPKFSTSLRLYSHRTVNNDAPSNSEGLLSHHLADGATFIMKDGHEYEDVFPLWDWSMIPGTTSEKKDLRPAKFKPGDWGGFAHIRYMGASTLVGGASNGKVGTMAADFKSNLQFEKVDAVKSWYFNELGFFAMGNSIRCQGNCEPIVTTIDQKWKRGEVYILGTDGKIFKHELNKKYTQIRAVFHDQTVYFFPKAQNVGIESKIKKANWSKINEQYTLNAQGEVFTLWLDHKTSDQYIYQVLPGVELEDFQKMQLNTPKYFNTATKMAYEHKDLLYVNLLIDQELKWNGQKIRCSEPCSLIYNKKNKTAYISDLSQYNSKLTVSINGKTKTINLPQVGYAGQSVSVQF